MVMTHTRKITISVGGSRFSTHWNTSSMPWHELVERLKTPQRTEETLEEFLRLRKREQDEKKDVGGYVGGEIAGPRRKAANVRSRDLVTLDLDNIPTGNTDDVVRRVDALGCGYVVYSTRKHAAYAPRLRVVIPLSRTISADEYEPIARKLCYLVGMEYADPLTFEVSRLMYWPSCSCDSEYVYVVGDKALADADGLLSSYTDWRDVMSWPQVPGHAVSQQRLVARQQDPLGKPGIVGIFCRTYSIADAMLQFLPKAYEETSDPERYTYLGGSTSGGAIVYDRKFLYSHHATDPCSGKLVNAFDMVRLHLFGTLDNEAKDGTPTAKMPSYLEMKKAALADDRISNVMNTERQKKALEAFRGDVDASVDIDWMDQLQKHENTGAIVKTINNVVLVMQNDASLKGKIAQDEFANRGMVLGSLPWDGSDEVRPWSDVDDAQLSRYLETFYGLNGQDKVDKALVIVSAMNRYNDVARWLESLAWDGTKRIDTLLSDYLGANQDVYSADVMRKTLTAAVSRAIVGATKFDSMPIITGPQGIGKSTFLRILGGKFFSDSLQTFEGKEAAEMIQGTWINEIGELTGLSRSELSAGKQFLSKQEDIYREAYGRRTNRYPRRCVFFGTTNDQGFLKDVTGNRRFWPVEAGLFPATKSVFDGLADERDQIWAEAYLLWGLGEPLYLSGESLRISEEMQEIHRESNAKEGVIADFITRKIPVNWDELGLSQRKMFWNGNLVVAGDLVDREKICALEIWCECFCGDPKYMKRMDTIEINNILGGMKGWVRNRRCRRYGYCGTQRGFEKELKNIGE